MKFALGIIIVGMVEQNDVQKRQSDREREGAQNIVIDIIIETIYLYESHKSSHFWPNSL